MKPPLAQILNEECSFITRLICVCGLSVREHPLCRDSFLNFSSSMQRYHIQTAHKTILYKSLLLLQQRFQIFTARNHIEQGRIIRGDHTRVHHTHAIRVHNRVQTMRNRQCRAGSELLRIIFCRKISVSLSSDAVASSMIRIFDFRSSARAMQISWR